MQAQTPMNRCNHQELYSIAMQQTMDDTIALLKIASQQKLMIGPTIPKLKQLKIIPDQINIHNLTFLSK